MSTPQVRKHLLLFAILCICQLALSHRSTAQDSISDKLAEFLYQGDLAGGERYMGTKLVENPKDGAARASLGIVQFFAAVEGLAKDYYRYGLAPQRTVLLSMGGMQLLPTSNPNPKEIDYETARNIFATFQERLRKADETLSTFQPANVKLPLDVSRLYLDLDDDGTKEKNIPIWKVVSMGQNVQDSQMAVPVIIAFDDADIYWLNGYIHVLLGTTDVLLAHDWRDAFERTAHFFFPKPKTPYPYLRDEGLDKQDWNVNEILDVIALIHVLNFEVTEPQRMKSALEHYEKVLALSRITWKQIRLEKDDDREWLPGPKQRSLVLSGQFGGDLGHNWERVLDRTEAVLQGKELLPFWRGVPQGNTARVHPDLGINLRKVFTEPRRFDLVLWLQGTGPKPFLEKGKLTDLQAWRDLSQSFGGNLPFFSFWIN